MELEQFFMESGILGSIGNNTDFQIQIAIAIVTLIISSIVGVIAFFLKRLFASIDYDSQQKIKHSGWLLKRTESYAEHYYIHLARSIIDLQSIMDKADKTKDLEIVKNTYSSTVKFIKQYLKFKKETGANFLFIERISENDAINNFQALFLSLPFDNNDIDSMSESFTGRQFRSFQNWINSGHCKNSKKIVLASLQKLAEVLDQQSEKILHYEEFLRTLREIKTIRKKRKIIGWVIKIAKYIRDRNPNVFYIHEVATKYVTPGSEVILLGNGFRDKKICCFDLLMNEDKSLQKSIIDNGTVKITIPNTTPIGTYDITATFTYHNGKNGNEPMGIVIHVI